MLRYEGDDDPIVALLAEVTVAELLAADVFRPRRSRSGEERLPGRMAIAQGGGDERRA